MSLRRKTVSFLAQESLLQINTGMTMLEAVHAVLLTERPGGSRRGGLQQRALPPWSTAGRPR